MLSWAESPGVIGRYRALGGVYLDNIVENTIIQCIEDAGGECINTGQHFRRIHEFVMNDALRAVESNHQLRRAPIGAIRTPIVLNGP